MPAVRLVDSRGPREGQVEVQLAGQEGTWGTVCVELWTGWDDGQSIADAVCRQLGYGGAEAFSEEGAQYRDDRTEIVKRPGSLPLLRDLDCGAGAASLNECSLVFAGDESCQVLRVTCVP